jgi:hypothetical protein
MLVPTNNGIKSFRKVIIHPWITAGGRLNWELIDRLFTAVIGVVYKHPGIQFRQIVKSLTPAISGVELSIILQALIHLDFVDAYKFHRSHSPGLVESRTTFTRVKEVDVFLELEGLCFEMKPFTTTKFARLQSLFYQDEFTEEPSDEITVIKSENLRSRNPHSSSESPVLPHSAKKARMETSSVDIGF